MPSSCTYETAGQRITTYYTPTNKPTPGASKDIPANQLQRQELNRQLRDQQKKEPTFFEKVKTGLVQSAVAIESIRSAVRKHGENNPWVAGGMGELPEEDPEYERPARKKHGKKKQKRTRQRMMERDDGGDEGPSLQSLMEVPPEFKRWV